MGALTALAGAELRLLARNTTAAGTGVAIPLVIGAVWTLNDPVVGTGAAAIVALQIIMLQAMTLHAVGVMTLASRRTQLTLKRWRASPASDTAILFGTLAAPVLLLVTQTAILAAITIAVWGDGPRHPVMLAFAVAATTVIVAALTCAVAAFTTSAEHATITTFPLVLVLIAAAVWTLSLPPGDVGPLLLAAPGAAAAQLIRLAWDGLPRGGAELVLAAVVASAALSVAAVALALRTFQWAPRR